ncbi:MAG TPA: cysteine--tRNA ligase, partial [Acidimicrobiales bacterium]|nr:cysteine--tRNA ligase [Acidimicrobiales bacterium]
SRGSSQDGYRTGMLRLYDTALGEITEIVPRQPGRFSMYVCGPTVYEVPHIGHGRAALVYDVLRRYLEWRGFDVLHVSNVTDIDDNIIRRAEEEGRPADEVARHYEQIWWDALDRLGVLQPTVVPHATEYVEDMVQLIEELVARGMAYESSDGVYLSVEKVDGYGQLTHQPLESLRAGARVEVDEAKRSPVDFALWKKAKPGEPSWPSPWGPGRPGWHTECVVMSLDLLGEDFDLHSGGLDLVFPHHENERAQAVALGRKFARHWMHHGFVEVAGEKMSKSLGNFTTLVDMLDRTDARAYRLLVLRSHYRTPIEVTPDTIADAQAGLERLDALARRFELGGPSSVSAERDQDAIARFTGAMDNDLDTPTAVAVIFELLRRANTAADAGDSERARRLAATVAELAGALGLELGKVGDEVDDESAALVERRDAARRARDFATADALRDELTARGWVVEDGPEGTSIRR